MAVVGPAAGPAVTPAAVAPPVGQATKCTQTFTVPQSETCDALASGLGLSTTSLQSLNSGISCDGPVPANQVLCIKGRAK